MTSIETIGARRRQDGTRVRTRISIVVPSYNMSRHLAKTIEFTQHVPEALRSSTELIVVDDGSSDDTRETVERTRTPLSLRYVSRWRDARSGRAAARNLGIKAARGDLLIFADAGILIDPEFLVQVVLASQQQPSLVGVAEVSGLWAPPESELEHVRSAAQLSAFVGERAEDFLWADQRKPLFRRCSGDMSLLPCPWSLGWTCLLSVPRELALQAGGFDEAFSGWGAEDTDFCYRLSKLGARFQAFLGASVHTPHGSSSDAAELERREQQHLENRRRLYRKQPSLQAEAYAAFLAIEDNLFLYRLAGMRVEYLLPVSAPSVLRELTNNLPSGPRLVLGAASPRIASAVGASVATVTSDDEVEWFAPLAPSVRTIQSFGSQLPLPDGELECAVGTDFIRLFPASVQSAQLAELRRAARQVRLVLTEDSRWDPWSRYRRDAAGWSWSSIDELKARAGAIGARLNVVGRVGETVLATLEGGAA
jgi:glycosyltransferase involved in cell wall biosynthesis